MSQNCWLQASKTLEKKKSPPILRGLNNLDPSPSHETSKNLRLITQPLAVRQSFQMSLALEIQDIPPFFKKEMPKKCQRSQFWASQIPKNPPGPTLDHPRSSTRPCLDASLLTCSWLNRGYTSFMWIFYGYKTKNLRTWKMTCVWKWGSDPQMVSSLGDDWG